MEDRKIISQNGNISAVILGWNCGEILEKQLPRLLKDAELYRQIILVDQNSTDKTLEVMAKFPEVTHIRNPVNLGSGKGRNVGLRVGLSDVGTDFIYSQDADIVTPYNLPRRMRQGLHRFPELGLLGAGHPDCQTEDLAKVDDLMPEITGYYFVTMLSYTYCAMQRREFYDKIEKHFGTPGIWWSEEGPYGTPGWGVDDNDFAFRGCKAGNNLAGFADLLWENEPPRTPKIYHIDHRCYQDLYTETGLWANQYGTAYERRVVLLYLDWAANYGTKVENIIVLDHSGNVDTIKQTIRAIHDEPKWESFGGYAGRPYRIVLPSKHYQNVTEWMWDKACRWTPNEPDANWGVRPIDGGLEEATHYAAFYHPQAKAEIRKVQQ